MVCLFSITIPWRAVSHSFGKPPLVKFDSNSVFRGYEVLRYQWGRFVRFHSFTNSSFGEMKLAELKWVERVYGKSFGSLWKILELYSCFLLLMLMKRLMNWRPLVKSLFLLSLHYTFVTRRWKKQITNGPPISNKSFKASSLACFNDIISPAKTKSFQSSIQGFTNFFFPLV